LAQRSKPKAKSKTRKSASNKGEITLLQDTLTKLNSLTKDAETTLRKVRRTVKEVAGNVADGAGDLASRLPVVGHEEKPKARKSASGAKKRAPKKSVASARASTAKKSSTSTGKKKAAASKS
jgi:hypothetical protein